MIKLGQNEDPTIQSLQRCTQYLHVVYARSELYVAHTARNVIQKRTHPEQKYTCFLFLSFAWQHGGMEWGGGKKGIDLVFLWGADPCQSTASLVQRTLIYATSVKVNGSIQENNYSNNNHRGLVSQSGFETSKVCSYDLGKPDRGLVPVQCAKIFGIRKGYWTSGRELI